MLKADRDRGEGRGWAERAREAQKAEKGTGQISNMAKMRTE